MCVFLFLSDVAITPMDAFSAANRAVSTGAEGRGVQLSTGSPSDQVLPVGFRYDINSMIACRCVALSHFER